MLNLSVISGVLQNRRKVSVLIIFLTNSIYLIDKEADLDAKDMGGRTPLL
jgi:hypothetical protein